ncbi:MAG: recombinase RecT [Thermodesulfovibrionales bacterium]|nr:recombinase RecT [Thermodesulfovibrionales bacterium]
MSNELTIKPEQSVTQKTVEDFLFSTGTKLTAQQKTMFMNLALTFGLNPFKREIYAVPYGNSFNYVTGYQVYISRAEATGKLDGWEVETIKDNNGRLIGARATVYRKDWSKPFIWEVSLNEFNRNNGNWRIMPEFMLKKVCIAQAFRLCFPNEFSGMPYIAEEIINEPVCDMKTIETNDTPESKSTVESLVKRLQEAKDLEHLRRIWEGIQPEYKSLDAVEQELVKTSKDRLKATLTLKTEDIEL